MKDDETNRWSLVITNNTGGEVHGFAVATAGRYASYPPPWPDGVSHALWTRMPGSGSANIAVSYSVWYADGDVDNLLPIEQITPQGGP